MGSGRSLHVWCEWGSARLARLARLHCDSTECGAGPGLAGLATVCRRRMGGGENTGYDSSGLVARASSSDDGGDSNEMRRGSRYASRDTVISADDGDGGPPCDTGAGGAGRAGRVGRVEGGGGAVRTGVGGAEGSLSGVWKPRGEAGLSGVWYPRAEVSDSPRTRATCSDSPAIVSSSSSDPIVQREENRHGNINLHQFFMDPLCLFLFVSRSFFLI